MEGKEEQNENNVDVLIQSSLIAIVEGNFHVAIEKLTKVIEKDDNNYKALLYRGIAHLNRGGYNLALKDFQSAETLRNADEDDEFFYLKGKTNFYLENLDDALNDLKKALTMKGLNEESKNKINSLIDRINNNK